MKRRTISITKLEQLVREGNNVTEIAKKMGFSKSAVSRAIKRLNIAVSRDVAIRKAPEVVEKNINAIEQLQKINDHANELLDLVMRWNRGDDEAIQILESQIANKKVRVGDQVEFVKQIKVKDPRELALKAMQEIRGQLKLQLEIFQALYDMAAVAEFQKEVLTAIGEVDQNVRHKIIRNLQKRRAIRSTLDLY